MSSVINSFFSNNSQGHLLKIKDGNPVIVDKKSVKKTTLIKAKLGFGSASLRTVSSWVARNQDQMEAGTHARFNRHVKNQSKNKVFWKQGKTVAPGALSKDIQGLNTNYRAEALFLDVKQNPTNENLQELAKAILLLDPQDKKGNKDLFNEILFLKSRFKDNAELKDDFKEVQKSVLKFHFSKRLKHMDEVLTHLEQRFQWFSGEWGPQEKFIQSQLEEWRERLDQGKPISIPKWYHCTKTSELVCTIADSKIKYMHKGTFPGAFVSNHPEFDFGHYGIAMSDRIEKTGTRVKNKNYVKFPKYSCHDEDLKITYGKIEYKEDPDVKIINEGSIWLGFQKQSGIPLKKRINQKNLLEKYKDNSLACIYYSSTKMDGTPEDGVSIRNFGKKHKIKVMTQQELRAIETLIEVTYGVFLPPEFENEIKPSSP